jgi:hypothetical protein
MQKKETKQNNNKKNNKEKCDGREMAKLTGDDEVITGAFQGLEVSEHGSHGGPGWMSESGGVVDQGAAQGAGILFFCLVAAFPSVLRLLSFCDAEGISV